MFFFKYHISFFFLLLNLSYFFLFFLNISFQFFFFIIIKKNFTSKLCQISHNRNELKTYFHGSSLRKKPLECIRRACGMIHRASYPMKRYQLVQILYPPFGRVGRQSHPIKIKNKCKRFLLVWENLSTFFSNLFKSTFVSMYNLKRSQKKSSLN